MTFARLSRSVRPVLVRVSHARLKLLAVAMHKIARRVWLMSATARGWWVCLCQHWDGKSGVPPSSAAACLPLYPFFSTCYLCGWPQPPSAVDQTALLPSPLRTDHRQSRKLTKGNKSPRRWRINTRAFTGVIFKKAASKWSCGGEQGRNATLKPFFCLPLTTNISTSKRQSGFMSGYRRAEDVTWCLVISFQWDRVSRERVLQFEVGMIYRPEK